MEIEKGNASHGYRRVANDDDDENLPEYTQRGRFTYYSREDAAKACCLEFGDAVYQLWTVCPDRIRRTFYVLAPHEVGPFVRETKFIHAVAIPERPTRIVIDLDQKFNPEHPHPFARGGSIWAIKTAWGAYARHFLEPALGIDFADQLFVAWAETDFLKGVKTSAHFVTLYAVESPAFVRAIVLHFAQWCTRLRGRDSREAKRFDRDALYAVQIVAVLLELQEFDLSLYHQTEFQLRIGFHHVRGTPLVPPPTYDPHVPPSAEEVCCLPPEACACRHRGDIPPLGVRVRGWVHPHTVERDGTYVPRLAALTETFYGRLRVQGAYCPSTRANWCVLDLDAYHFPVYSFDVERVPTVVSIAESAPNQRVFADSDIGRALLQLVESQPLLKCKKLYNLPSRRPNVMVSVICICHGFQYWFAREIGEPACAFTTVGALRIARHDDNLTKVQYALNRAGTAVYAKCFGDGAGGTYRLVLEEGKLRLHYTPMN